MPLANSSAVCANPSSSKRELSPLFEWGVVVVVDGGRGGGGGGEGEGRSLTSGPQGRSLTIEPHQSSTMNGLHATEWR